MFFKLSGIPVSTKSPAVSTQQPATPSTTTQTIGVGKKNY